MKLHKASVKLAGLYLGIMMLISLAFSISVYQLSVQELNRGFHGTPGGQGRSVDLDDPDFDIPANLRFQILKSQDRHYSDAKRRILQRLIAANVLILLGGGLLSYFLASRTLKPIEEAHKAQSRFTADASHELRTPITAMRTENEVALLNPKLTLSQAKQQLKSNIEELEKLTGLTEGLLRLASINDAGIQKVELSVANLATKAVARVLPEAEKKGILIQDNIEDSIVVPGDEASLTEALVILLDNAIKYSPEHTEVKVSAVRHQKHIIIEVQDQGIGIKASEQPHIFERFYRADTARSKQNIPGYGLGLAIAKNIVDLHRGELSVASHPGKGSTFIVTLPSKA